MIGLHLQNSVNGWPDAVAKLPPGTPVKFCFGVERAREAKARNPRVKTWYRWVGSQPLPTSDFEGHARRWLANFVDGTFRREAKYVDFIQEYNETLANSQFGTAERDRWVQLHTAFAKVWKEEYRTQPELAHIRMILCETAVGNDLVVEGDVRLAAAAVKYDAVLGYHAYAHVVNGRIDPGDWRYHSGRWSFMDDICVRAGLRPIWAFGEMGPYEGASDGWRSKTCLSGDFDAYLDVLTYWLDRTVQTRAYRENRLLGGVLFTTGAPGSGPDWSTFEVDARQLARVADLLNAYDWPSTTPPPPPPDPDPDPPSNGAPRVQYAREVWVAPQDATRDQFVRLADAAFERRNTVGFSYDDAGIGDLASRKAVLFGIAPAREAEFKSWYANHYPGVVVEFADFPTPSDPADPTKPKPRDPFGLDRHGVDISGNQGRIDWSKMGLRDDVDFVYMRATAGGKKTNWNQLVNGVDVQFARNWREGKGRKPRGAYHVWRSSFSVTEQVDLFLSTLDGDYGERPPVLDFEDQTPVSPTKLFAWLNQVEAATGWKPVVYTAPGYWNAVTFEGALTPWANDYFLWVADPDDGARPDIPAAWSTWRIWQYSWNGNGKLYGTQGSLIDLNRVNMVGGGG